MSRFVVTLNKSITLNSNNKKNSFKVIHVLPSFAGRLHPPILSDFSPRALWNEITAFNFARLHRILLNCLMVNFIIQDQLVYRKIR